MDTTEHAHSVVGTTGRNRKQHVDGERETLIPAGGGEERLSRAAEERSRAGPSLRHRSENVREIRSDQGARGSLVTKRKD